MSLVSNIDVSIRNATVLDVPFMVALSLEKRLAYEKAQPQFWRYAKGAETVQQEWFEELLNAKDHIILVAESLGFVIGRLVKAPEVYDPGGLTLMIDDFCVKTSSDWGSVGSLLINNLKLLAQEKGATQILVVVGHHDEMKRSFVTNLGLKMASEWYVGSI